MIALAADSVRLPPKVRLLVPAVVLLERVTTLVRVLMAVMVVPAGMKPPLLVTNWPTASPTVFGTVTVFVAAVVTMLFCVMELILTVGAVVPPLPPKVRLESVLAPTRLSTPVPLRVTLLVAAICPAKTFSVTVELLIRRFPGMAITPCNPPSVSKPLFNVPPPLTVVTPV